MDISMVYGILVLLGGVMGYLKAHSLMSLASGVVSGLLIIGLSKVPTETPQAAMIQRLGLIVMSLALGGFFAVRFLNSGKIMPAGVIVALSACHLLWLMLKKPMVITEAATSQD